MTTAKLFKNKQLWLAIIMVSIGLGCCSFPILSDNAIKTDRDNCYKKLSEDFGVPPSYGEIRKEFFSQLQNRLKPGMKREEVFAVLEEFSPTSTKWKMTSLDGNIIEYIVLETCDFQKNNFPFLLVYSQKESFEKVVNYVDD